MRTTRSHGFTLMELLVVISVIALLLAILSPSITQVQHNVRQSLCTKNLHYLGNAFTNRLAEMRTKGLVPISPQGWENYLLTYASGDQPLLRCTEETRNLGEVFTEQLMGEQFALATYSGGTFLYNMPLEENPCTKKIGGGNSFDLSFEDQRDSTGTKEASYSDHSFANPTMHVDINGNKVTISVAGGGGGYIWNLIGPDGKILINSVMKDPKSLVGASVTVDFTASSYGMNSVAGYFRHDGQRYITLLDYQTTVAYLVDHNHAQDNWASWMQGGQYTFARHFGKVNVMYSDGSVGPLVSVDDINPTGKVDLQVKLWGLNTQPSQ